MLGLYIHIPFCANKCYYCDFTSYIRRDHLIDDYIEAVLLELALYSHEKFDTIFIGGGTPSYLNEKQLYNLLNGISRYQNLDNIREFTIECNPGTLNHEKLRIMKSFGVNRLSIGLQSANSDTLKFIGRIHSFDDFEKSISYAHDIGFTNISADIIFAIPNERMEDYKRTLDKIVKYDLTHISAYNLILEENTKFYNMYKKGNFSELKEDIQVDMYRYTKYFLESNGFKQYEISNYSNQGKECIHNLIYWNFNEYIGLGVSAHSFYKNSRLENTKDINKYIKMLKNRNHIYEYEYKNSVLDNMEEYLIVGFRKNEGVSISEFKSKFNFDLIFNFNDVINKYKSLGFLDISDDRIFITFKGFMVMNQILEKFLMKIR